jgi:predicted HTH transcriptional regulator
MSTAVTTPPPAPTFDDALIDRLLDREEDYQFDCKRIKTDLTRLVETIVAFANSDGGTLAIGLEDPEKATGRDRVYTVANIQRIGTHNRNPNLVGHLREFPEPPNVDAGEGVRMMFGTMQQARLYPPLYITRPQIEKEAVVIHLFNENRPSAWEQVSAYIDQHGSLGNAEIRQLMGHADTLKASQQIKEWRDLGLLIVANPHEGKRVRRYIKPNRPSAPPLFSKPP